MKNQLKKTNDIMPEHLQELDERIRDIVFEYVQEHRNVALPIPALVATLIKLIRLGLPGLGDFVLAMLRDALGDNRVH